MPKKIIKKVNKKIRKSSLKSNKGYAKQDLLLIFAGFIIGIFFLNYVITDLTTQKPQAVTKNIEINNVANAADEKSIIDNFSTIPQAELKDVPAEKINSLFNNLK